MRHFRLVLTHGDSGTTVMLSFFAVRRRCSNQFTSVSQGRADNCSTRDYQRDSANGTRGGGRTNRDRFKRVPVLERLGEERGALVGQPDRNCLIFPNVVVNDK